MNGVNIGVNNYCIYLRLLALLGTVKSLKVLILLHLGARGGKKVKFK